MGRTPWESNGSIGGPKVLEDLVQLHGEAAHTGGANPSLVRRFFNPGIDSPGTNSPGTNAPSRTVNFEMHGSAAAESALTWPRRGIG